MWRSFNFLYMLFVVKPLDQMPQGVGIAFFNELYYQEGDRKV